MAVWLHLNHRRLQRWRRTLHPPRNPCEVELPTEMRLHLAHTPGGDRLCTRGLSCIELPELELVRIRPELRQVARRVLPLAAREIVWQLLQAGGRAVVFEQLSIGPEPGVGVHLSMPVAGVVRLHPAEGPDAPPTRLLTALRATLLPFDPTHPVPLIRVDPAELTHLQHRFHRGLGHGARLFVLVGTPDGTGACWIEVLRWTPSHIAGRLASEQPAAWGHQWGERVVASPGAVRAWRVDHVDGRTETGTACPAMS